MKSINGLLMENLRTKTKVTSQSTHNNEDTHTQTHSENLVHLVLKLYTLDLFGNVINLLHLYARARNAEQ